MRHILIIISISLFSSFLVSCEKNGPGNGQGTLNLPDGGKYVGEFKDGNANGQGTFTFPNGGKYVGEFKDGNRHGQGTTIFAEGDKFVGEWLGVEKVQLLV